MFMFIHQTRDSVRLVYSSHQCEFAIGFEMSRVVLSEQAIITNNWSNAAAIYLIVIDVIMK